MKLYSLYRIIDGKWEIVLHIRRDDNWEYKHEARPDIRAFVDQHYSLTPEAMAKLLIENVLHCEAVEISNMSGQGLVLRKCDDKVSK